MKTKLKVTIKVAYEHDDKVKLNDIRASVVHSVQSKLLDHNAMAGSLPIVVVGDPRLSVVEEGM